MRLTRSVHFFFFLNDPPPPKINPLPLPAALPINPEKMQPQYRRAARLHVEKAGTRVAVEHQHDLSGGQRRQGQQNHPRDRKSTRLNSSHSQISYAVFCLKKKKKHITLPPSCCASL